MRQTRTGTFDRNIFTHKFSQFRGLRQTQSALHHDSRFVRELSGVRCPQSFLEKKQCYSRLHRVLQAPTGFMLDENQVCFSFGSALYIMAWEEWLNTSTYQSWWADMEPIAKVDGESTWSDSKPFSFADE